MTLRRRRGPNGEICFSEAIARSLFVAGIATRAQAVAFADEFERVEDCIRDNEDPDAHLLHTIDWTAGR